MRRLRIAAARVSGGLIICALLAVVGCSKRRSREQEVGGMLSDIVQYQSDVSAGTDATADGQVTPFCPMEPERRATNCCVEAPNRKGCEDEEVESCVCEQYPECCDVGWEKTCAGFADTTYCNGALNSEWTGCGNPAGSCDGLAEPCNCAVKCPGGDSCTGV